MSYKMYDFGEKESEFNSKLGKDVPVWKSPKYLEAKEKAIKVIESDTFKGIIQAEDFWILQNATKSGKIAYAGLILSHNACLKINDRLPAEKKFKPECITVDKDGYNGSLVFIYNCSSQGIFEVGEVSKSNCHIEYLYAIGLKRCMDRVILKNSKLAYSGIYSEVESEEFHEPERETKPVVEDPKEETPVTEKKPTNIKAELVEFCKNNRIDIKALCKEYELTNASPEKDFEKALKYAQFLAKKNALNK